MAQGRSGTGRAGGRGPGRTRAAADRARPAPSATEARAARTAGRPRPTPPPPDATVSRLPERRSLRRTLVLAGVLVMLAILVVPTLRSYLRQESEISAMEAKVQAQREDVARLQREQARWADPAFVEQQARERLGFVKPGERSYVVLQPDAPEQAPDRVATVPVDDRDVSWYSRMWESVEVADDPAEHTATGQ